jgi:hypothetical protein
VAVRRRVVDCDLEWRVVSNCKTAREEERERRPVPTAKVGAAKRLTTADSVITDQTRTIGE